MLYYNGIKTGGTAMDRDLKYRHRLSSSVDLGIYKAFHNYATECRIPMSRLLDEAIGDFLDKNDVEYELTAPYKFT